VVVIICHLLLMAVLLLYYVDVTFAKDPKSRDFAAQFKYA
jgi:hypothetical protein